MKYADPRAELNASPSLPPQSTMVTLADETTEDEAEDLIDLTSAKQQRQWTVAQSAQHSNHRLQHSPKVTFFDTDNASATRGEEEKNDRRDRSYQSSLGIRFVGTRCFPWEGCKIPCLKMANLRWGRFSSTPRACALQSLMEAGSPECSVKKINLSLSHVRGHTI